jgi:hypothetical protein
MTISRGLGAVSKMGKNYVENHTDDYGTGII